MSRHMHRHGPKMIFGIFALLAVFSLIVMLLWNAVMPSLVGVGSLNYLRAVGLLALCRILFGNLDMGFRGRRMREHFRSMSPEHREAFVRHLCERFDAHAAHGEFGEHSPRNNK